MKLYFKRGVMSGFIITLLIINGQRVYAYVNINKLIDASAAQRRSLLITINTEKILTTTVDLEKGQLSSSVETSSIMNWNRLRVRFTDPGGTSGDYSTVDE
jgi:hypothetical protein